MSTTVAAPMTFKQVLGITVMRRIWYAQIVSLLGDFLALFAVISNEAMVLSGLVGIGVGVFLLGALPYVPATVVATFTIGFAFAGIIVPAQTLMQQETPPALMGRISSTVMSVVFFAQVLGLVLSGVLGQALGVRAVFFLCAALAATLDYLTSSPIGQVTPVPARPQ